jgi:hypothetical protein
MADLASLKDPDDVSFAAADRKHQIREQIKELQRGLERVRRKRKKSKGE